MSNKNIRFCSISAVVSTSAAAIDEAFNEAAEAEIEAAAEAEIEAAAINELEAFLRRYEEWKSIEADNDDWWADEHRSSREEYENWIFESRLEEEYRLRREAECVVETEIAHRGALAATAATLWAEGWNPADGLRVVTWGLCPRSFEAAARERRYQEECFARQQRVEQWGFWNDPAPEGLSIR